MPTENNSVRHRLLTLAIRFIFLCLRLPFLLVILNLRLVQDILNDPISDLPFLHLRLELMVFGVVFFLARDERRIFLVQIADLRQRAVNFFIFIKGFLCGPAAGEDFTVLFEKFLAVAGSFIVNFSR